MAIKSRLECRSDEETMHLGNPLRFTIVRYNNSYTHTLSYKCGSLSSVIAVKTSETEIEWTPPVSLAEQFPNSQFSSVDIMLETYSGNFRIGVTSMNLRLYIPITWETVPDIEYTITDSSGCFEKYGLFVLGKSDIEISVKVRTKYGASLSYLNVKYGYSTIFEYYPSNEDTSNGVYEFTTHIDQLSMNMDYPDAVSIRFNVTDSRNINFGTGDTYEVLEYSRPKLSDISIQRCNSNATLNPNGNYLRVDFDASVSPLNNKNSVTYSLKYKKISEPESAYKSVSMSSLNDAYVIFGASTVFAADPNESYNIIFSIADDFEEITKTGIGNSVKKLWSMLAKGLGFAFGKIAERENALDMGFDIYMNEKRIKALPDPIADDEPVPKRYVDKILHADSTYPGCLYYTDGTTKYWLNPPLLEGVEYATMERVDNKTVYCQFIKLRVYIYTNMMQHSFVEHGIDYIDKLIRMNAYCASGYYNVPLPWIKGQYVEENGIFDTTFLTVHIYPNDSSVLEVDYKNPFIVNNGYNDICVTLYYTKN